MRQFEHNWRAQKISERGRTGVGFFTKFSIPADAQVRQDLPNAELSGFGASHPELSCGADFILFIRHGSVAFLEGFTFEEDWPEDESKFCVRTHAASKLHFGE